jgi:hypothetical protein
VRISDTSDEATKLQLETVRQLTPERRLEAALELSQLARDMIAEGIHTRHPEYDDAQVQLALKRVVLPRALFELAYPNTPPVLP